MKEDTISRIESELEVQTYLQNLRYALAHGATIEFQAKRLVDEKRELKYTNLYTVNTLFPNEKPTVALKRELATLTEENYIRTVRDLHRPNKSELREFGKVYSGNEDVYIKIRVELLGTYGKATTFVMSFHFAEKAFNQEMFPYRKTGDDYEDS